MTAILATNGSAASTGGMIFSLVLMFVLMYFVMIRPQQKEAKKKSAMLADLAVGDTILTTSGFYGIVIDIDEEDDLVIVEFGSNKNCRIPMQRQAITMIEKPEQV